VDGDFVSKSPQSSGSKMIPTSLPETLVGRARHKTSEIIAINHPFHSPHHAHFKTARPQGPNLHKRLGGRPAVDDTCPSARLLSPSHTGCWQENRSAIGTRSYFPYNVPWCVRVLLKETGPQDVLHLSREAHACSARKTRSHSRTCFLLALPLLALLVVFPSRCQEQHV
jgi:hypothetical protein